MLVQRYTALVFSVACRVTGNTSTAEDITQDCFLALADKAATIRGSLPAWLHRVALNRSIFISRNEAKRRHHEVHAFSPPKTAGESNWNNITPFIDAALTKLPDDLREPLIQHFLLGHTQAQIAENLHVGQATVSRRIQEGIERLREHLQKAGVVCGVVALSSMFAKNATAAVPKRLAISLAKMAMAGPTVAKSLGLSALIKTILLKKTACAILAASIVAVVSVSATILFVEDGQAGTPVTNNTLRKGLVLHFSFDGAKPGGQVIDLSGRKNHGKASGVRWTPNGRKGGAYEFTADGDQVEVLNNDSLNPEQITLAAWIKTSFTDDKWRRIFDKSYSQGYAMSIAGDWQATKWRGRACVEIGPGTHLSLSNNVVADGQWRHIVFTCDGTEQRLYVDGQPQNRIVRWRNPGRVGATEFNLVIGCNRSNLHEDDLGLSFRGLIDEPMIWNRA